MPSGLVADLRKGGGTPTWDQASGYVAPHTPGDGIQVGGNTVLNGAFNQANGFQFILGAQKFATSGAPLGASTTLVSRAYAWNGTDGQTVNGASTLLTRMLSATQDDCQLEIGVASFTFIKAKGASNIWEQVGLMVASRSGSGVNDQSQDTFRLQPGSSSGTYYRGLACYAYGASYPASYSDRNGYLFVPTPTDAAHAASKGYVDSVAGGGGFSGGSVSGRSIFAYPGSATNDLTRFAVLAQPSGASPGNYGPFAYAPLGATSAAWFIAADGTVNQNFSSQVDAWTVKNGGATTFAVTVHPAGYISFTAGAEFFFNQKVTFNGLSEFTGICTFDNKMVRGINNQSSAGTPFTTVEAQDWAFAWNGGSQTFLPIYTRTTKEGNAGTGGNCISRRWDMDGKTPLALYPLGVTVGAYDPPDAATVLDLRSGGTLGLGLPLMTTAQRTALSPSRKGVGVFDTDLNKAYCWDGAAWNALW
jgi:hypothetical protein